MAQHGFPMSGGQNGGSIDPSYVYGLGNHSSSNGFSSGAALFDDDELLDGLNSPGDGPHGLNDFSNGLNNHGSSYTNNIYGSHQGSMPFNQSHINGYSNTPDGDPIQSPFVHAGMNQYRPMPQAFAGSMHSPLSYGGSPMATGDMNNDGTDANYLKARARMSQAQAQAMQRKGSNPRNPLTPKTATLNGLSMNSTDGFPIRTATVTNEKPQPAQFIPTPNSIGSFPASGFTSPLNATQLHNANMTDILRHGGASMPAKLGNTGPPQVSSQEAKRKRRRESHNLVERRRRDNINERIQDLSKLVPAHRLDDEKIRKAIQNGTPLSPTLQPGVPNSAQATSALAGPGARRATSAGTAGNITTGLPLEDKDKGPNKGDILNGAVSWTRDLMWMLNLKMQQQEELVNTILELGGRVPFEFSDDERRMQTELYEALNRNEEGTTHGKPNTFTYSRTAGTGLRVPHHTDYKGEPLNGNGHGGDHISISPEDDAHGAAGHMLDAEEFVDYDDDGSGELNFKDEDDFGMDLTQ